jgi:hypothetical protein
MRLCMWASLGGESPRTEFPARSRDFYRRLERVLCVGYKHPGCLPQMVVIVNKFYTKFFSAIAL